MPHNLSTLTQIKLQIFPLIDKTEEFLKSLAFIAFNPQPSINFDLNDFLGLLLLIEKPEEISLCLTVLLKALNPSQFSMLTTKLIKHQVQTFYSEGENTFLRADTLLTKMFNREFPQEDTSFITIAGLYLGGLATRLAKEFSATLQVSWDKSFVNDMISILQNFLGILITTEYLQTIPDIVRQNCHSLLTQLQLYAPYIYEEGSAVKVLSAQQQDEEDAANLHLNLLVRVGSYFFLRYLNPSITSFCSNPTLIKMIDKIPLEPIIDRLTKAQDSELVKIIEELKNCRFDTNPEHLEELKKTEHAKRYKKTVQLRTLAKYLLISQFNKLLITVIAHPLMKLIDSIDPNVNEENINWCNTIPAWHKALEIFFTTPPSRAQSSPNKGQSTDWKNKFTTFLKKVSQKPSVIPVESQLVNLSHRSRSKSHLKEGYPLGAKITDLLNNTCTDPWVPNNSFFHAIKTQNRAKVEWFLLRVVNIDLLQGIEAAYLTAQRMKTNITIKMTQQSNGTESRPSSTIEDEDSDMTDIPINSFDDRDPKKQGYQIILTALTLLEKLEKYLANPQLQSQIFDEAFKIEITPYQTQALSSEEIFKLVGSSVKTSPRGITSNSLGKWIIYSDGRHTKGKQTEEHGFDLRPILERALRRLLQKQAALRLDLPRKQPDLHITFLFKGELLCEIKFQQILQIIVQLFAQENSNSNNIESILIEEITKAYIDTMSTLHSLHDTLQPNKMPKSNQKLVEINLTALRKVPVANITDLHNSIFTLFAKNDMRGLNSLRQHMAEDVVTQLQNFQQKLLGCDEDDHDNLSTTDILFLLLNHLVRTEQPTFTLAYIANSQIYKQAFQKRLMCCYFLRQCLVSTVQQAIESNFRTACSKDITLIRLIITFQNKNLRLDDSRNVETQVKTLLPYFTENVKAISLSPLSPRSDSPRAQSSSPRASNSPRGSSFLDRGGLLLNRKGSRTTDLVEVSLGDEDTSSSNKSSSGRESPADSPRSGLSP